MAEAAVCAQVRMQVHTPRCPSQACLPVQGTRRPGAQAGPELHARSRPWGAFQKLASLSLLSAGYQKTRWRSRARASC